MDDMKSYRATRDYSKQNYNTPIAIVALLALVLISVPFMVKLIGYSVDRQAVVDCTGWQQQAAEYHNFFITNDEKAECDSVNMTVSAPVK